MFDKIAKLAKLDFTPLEKKQLTRDIEEIVGYFEALNEVNTDGVQPTTHIHGLMHDLREDIMQPWFSQNAALQNVPSSNSGYFSVPKVIK